MRERVPRALALAPDGWSLEILDQTALPHQERIIRAADVEDVVRAIATMQVRGAPLIGIAAAYGMALAARANPDEASLAAAARELSAARPTAVNLGWAVDRMSRRLLALPPAGRAVAAYQEAAWIAEAEVSACRAIGDHGVGLIRALAAGAPGRPVRILTHCNAGWLATLDYGTALAPVYRADEDGVAVHVWVSETRPRNQGWLTAWELGRRGVSHTVVADNAAGHLLHRGEVDLVLVGTDRTTRCGDVCNKVGTYLKALAARDAGVPFYAAVPSSSIDWRIDDWRTIPIEQRDAGELTTASGPDALGQTRTVRLAPHGVAAANPAFDVTPAALVTGLITERGICPASEAGLRALFPEDR